MKILYYDCFAGISGDMNLGALIDLGVDVDYLKTELGKLNIEGFHLEIEPDSRRGISGTKATVVVENPDNEKHRHLRHVEEIVNNSTLNDNVKTLSLKIFRHIAEAEAKVHNIDIQRVHFHEVGALDSIADIVGAAICLDFLKVDKVMSSPIQLGGGTVKCAHGIMPVPAPATALIVEGIPVKTGLVHHEATTPTGAAILAATVNEFSEALNLSVSKTGYGIGQRDVSEVPNVLRVFLSETTNNENDWELVSSIVLECNIDDMNPEHYEFLFKLLFEAGASDVWLTPIVMKKMRPANTLSVLANNNLTDKLKSIVFQHTTTLGIRQYKVEKTILKRELVSVSTQYGEVKVKICRLNGRVISSKPENSDCERLAKEHGLPISIIENEVIKLL